MPAPALPSPHLSSRWLTKQGRNANVSLPSKPPGWEKTCLYTVLEEETEWIHTGWPPSVYQTEASWLTYEIIEENHFAGCGKWVVAFNYLPSPHVKSSRKSMWHVLFTNYLVTPVSQRKKKKSPTLFSTPSYSPEVTRIRIQLAQKLMITQVHGAKKGRRNS